MKKVLRYILIITLSHLLAVQAISADSLNSEVNSADNIRLEFEMKNSAEFIKLMLQVGEQINQDSQVDQEIFNISEKLTELIKEKMQIYHQYFEKSLNIPNGKKEIFKRAFLALKWNNILPLIKKSQLQIDLFFKKKGIGITLAMLIGDLCKIIIPIVLPSIGLSHLIPILVIQPYAVVFAAIPMYMGKVKIQNLVTSELGGKPQFEAYKAQQELFFKNLKMQHPDDLIFPVVEDSDGVKSLVIQKDNWKNGLLNFMGFNKDALNIRSLKKFLLENNISDKYIDWVLENNNIDKTIQTELITTHLFNSKNKEIEVHFHAQFSSKILTLKGKNNWQELWSWTNEMQKIKSLNDLMVSIDNTPDNFHPKELALIIESFLIPEYIKNLDLSYSEARTMQINFEALKAKLNTMEDSVSDLEVKNVLATYLKKIMTGKKFNGCQNPASKINSYLLRKAL